MDKLIGMNQVDELLLDTRDIAGMTKKRHDNLIRDIDGYVDILRNSTDLKFEVSDFFVEGTYFDSTGRTLRKYDATRKGCNMIANKMTGEKGVLFTAAYVTKFEEMEKQITYSSKSIPSYMIDNPRDRAMRWVEEYDEMKMIENKAIMLEQKASEYQHKASYVDLILKSKSTVTTTQIAKDYGLSAKELNAILHEEKIQFKQNKQWLLYSKYQDKGYTNSFSIEIEHKNGEIEVKMFTRWSQSGRLFIHEILKRRSIKPNLEKKYDSVR